MSLSHETNPSLILRLPTRSDSEAWSEFARLYEPMIYRFAKQRGMQDADALELVQNVMLGVARSIERWVPDPQKGTFRTWLFRIAKYQWLTMISKKRLDIASGRSTDLLMLHALPKIDPREEEIDSFRREVFRVAAAQVRESCHEKTWEAFWRTAILDEDATAVASSLAMTVGSVYIARSRVTHRLRELIQVWEKNDAL